MNKYLVLVLLCLILANVGCAKKQEKEPIVTPKVEQTQVDTAPETVSVTAIEVVSEASVAVVLPEGKAYSPLTGLIVDSKSLERRPVGVMINNFSEACPQSGIEQADIIYETLAEGAITRLFAVFQTFDAPKIGPVRSARHYFLDFAFDMDAIYVHFGHSPQAAESYKKLNAPNLEGLSGLESIMSYRDTTRKAPHNLYMSQEGIFKAWDKVGYRTERDPNIQLGFLISQEPIVLKESKAVTHVFLPFGDVYNGEFKYDVESQTYLRFQRGDKQIDKETGNQLKFTNVIIQLTNTWNIKGDSSGRLDMELVGKGDGYFMTMGQMVPITWSKASHIEPTVYALMDGTKLTINKGKTWIAVFPNDKRKQKIVME